MVIESALLFWFLACIGVVLTGISKSGFAGGAGVLAVPLMALVIPVSDAIVIMLPLLLMMDIKMIHYFARSADWRLLRLIIPGAMLGIALAGLLLGTFSDRTLEFSLGLISLLFAGWQRLTSILSSFPGSAIIWSTLSGFSSTLIHAGGPPIHLYLLSQNLKKLTWLATAAFFFGAMNLFKLVPYTLNNQWSADNLTVTVLLLPAALTGIWLGKQLQSRLPERLFLDIIRCLLLLTGSILLLKAILAPS